MFLWQPKEKNKAGEDVRFCLAADKHKRQTFGTHRQHVEFYHNVNVSMCFGGFSPSMSFQQLICMFLFCLGEVLC